jgi:hypothetical protein
LAFAVVIIVVIIIVIIVAPAHALLTVSHHLSICSTRHAPPTVAELSNQSKPNQSNPNEASGAALARAAHTNSRSIAIFIAIALATPWPRSCRSVANLSLRASSIFEKLMRPTGEAFEPVSFAVVLKPARPRLCAAATQSLLLRGFWRCNPLGSIPLQGS